MVHKPRFAILISGRGSNMIALLDAAAQPDYPAQAVLVLSDIAQVAGLEAAEQRGITAFAVPRDAYGTRQAHEAALESALRAAKVDYICLAGYMRLISPEMAARWEGRMLNIHPSLLPDFKGLDTHQRALDAGGKAHGCTVHLVTAALDDGPILGQATVPIYPEDTAQSLAKRVLKEEHLLYADCLKQLILQGIY